MFPDSSAVIVDFGTAITVDAVSAEGQYLGGAIAPGVDTAASALFSSTAQIRRVQLLAPSAAIGKTTVGAVQSGIMFGTAALVDGLIERVSEELDGDVEVIATGGLAPVIIEHCKLIKRFDPMLTLNGLRLIFELNINEG